MGLAEDFKTEQETKRLSQQFQLEEDFRAHLRDKEQGGSIKQAPVPSNTPLGATIGGVGTALATRNPVAATLGAVAGEAGQQLFEHATGSPNAPKTTEEAALRMTREGLTQGAFETIGGAGSFLVDKARAFAPFAKSVQPEAKEAMKFVEQHGGSKSSLLPAEMTSNRFLDIMQNISEHSLLGGGAVATFKKDRDLFNTKLAETIVARHGPHMDPDDVGRAVVDSATKNLEAAKYQSKIIYGAIESQAAPQYARAPKKVTVQKTTEPVTDEPLKTKTIWQDIQEAAPQIKDIHEELGGLKYASPEEALRRFNEAQGKSASPQTGDRLRHMRVMVSEQETQVGGTRIDLRPLKDELEDMTRTAKEGGGLADAAMGNTLMKFISSKPDLVSYPVAKAMRTEVRAYRDQLKGSLETKNAPGIGKADSVYGKLTERIRAGLADDDPFLSTMWDEANLIEAGANQQFNTKFIRELVKLADMKGGGAPEAIAEKVWRAGRPTQIKVVRNALDPLAWNKLQRIEMQTLMENSMENGIPNGTRMEKAFFGKEGLGEEALQAGFDPATVKEVKGFINALKVQQSKAPDGTGRVWIQLAQATTAVQMLGAAAAVTGLASEEFGGPGLTAAGSAILFGPAVVSQIMTRPGGIKWLTEGLSAAPRSAKLLHAATQIAKTLEATIPREGPAQQAPVPSTQLPGQVQQE